MGSQKMAHTGVSLRNDGVDEASHVFQHEILALNQQFWDVLGSSEAVTIHCWVRPKWGETIISNGILVTQNQGTIIVANSQLLDIITYYNYCQ